MERGSGVLLPVFSLPSDYGIGTFGREAYRFVRFLAASKQKYWQMLPLNPTSYGDSPYQSFSAFALNPYFIDLKMLIAKGYLKEEDVLPLKHRYERKIDYGEEYALRFPILKKAYANSKASLQKKTDSFARSNKNWLNDYALFMVIKGLNGGKSWLEWEEKYKMRDAEALKNVLLTYKDDIGFWTWCQYMAFTQYRKLKKYANKRNIRIIGDIPIYVASDSADVWANYKFFQLGKDRRPLLVAGVPPDYFSATGQLWGNPLYDYEKMKKNHFKWWKQRVKKCTKLFDVLRIDHFRGMEAYWAVPGQDKTAVNGHWIKGPGMDLINAIKEGAGSMEIIAEDLGLLTPEVVKLKDQARWPGLVVLEFGFDPNDTQFTSNYLPENYKQECVAYAGTHDNDTLAHFLECQKDLLPTIARYLKITDSPKVADIVKEGQEPQIQVQEIPDLKKMHRRLLQKLMLSKADVVIYLMQDLLFEGGEYRINTPGTSGGNWQYRLAKDYDKNMDLISNLAEEVELARR